MTFKRSHTALAAVVSGAILFTGGMAMGEPDGPVRMANLKVSGLTGFEVQDLTGMRVGEIAYVETDGQGRTRWLGVELDAGGEARVASFRADLDAKQKLVSLRLSEDLLIARADAAAAAAAISSPSA
jgi:hypothetical protein